MKEKFNTIGKKVIRQDGLEKVTGTAKFADDYLFPRMLYGVMVRVPVAHAIIKNIDYGDIEKSPHVMAICDASDIPGAKNVGAIRKDQPVFVYDKIRSAGDVVAMLTGEDENELRKAAIAVKIETEELPLLTDPLYALEKDAPLIHPQYKNNLIVHYPLRKGNTEKGFAESDIIIEQKYTTPHVEHAYIEPETVIALPREGNKGVHILGSIQNPHTTRRVVAAVLGWPLAKVRVEQADMGGSFGGKDDTMNVLAARAALGALKTGRPVKIRFQREESILESYKRHPYVMKYKVGFTSEGKIKAMEIDITADGGAYSSMSPFVTWRSVVQATGPYEIEHVKTDVRAVYTNNPYTGAFRGFGSPQPIFAQESLIDEIAVKTGKTPDEIRRINGFRPGSYTASGQKLEDHEVTLLTVLDEACQRTDFAAQWKKHKRAQPELSAVGIDENSLLSEGKDIVPAADVWKKGIGLAVSYRGCALGAEGVDAAAAYLSVQNDGSVYLLSGLAENGQGLRTTFNIIAAEVLGISPTNIFYLDHDTGYVQDSGPTVASRSTLMGGGAVKNAAEIVKERLIGLLKEEWGLQNGQQPVFANNEVTVPDRPDLKISFSELCGLAAGKGISLAALGWYKGPDVHWEEETGQGSAYFTYVYGCQVAEVSVNINTGEVYVDKITAVHDPGTVINRLGAEGQVYGGVTQGAGYGLWEEISAYKGFIRELNFDQYLIPTSKDIGDIEAVFVEGKEKYGAWGAKSLGEPTLELTAAAIANAVANATGKRFFHLPLNLEEILLTRKLKPEDLKRGSN